VPDAVRRALIEDYAQDALMRRFRRRGFEVVDARRGHPYDAVATKAGQRLYLEAKGTTCTEPVVEITSNELEHTRRHRDDCVLGVVVDITFVGATRQDPGRPAGGKLYVFQPWDPDHGELTPTRYRHTPSGAASEPALRL
jgi:hypothetical protein